ncbi:MAG: prolyl oligopeptidase family serine peptidase, partial [Polyangiaceae bacterium]|nr:prolyl oligopeptidase family serine peptidase [Polyangiaceae bacterium]
KLEAAQAASAPAGSKESFTQHVRTLSLALAAGHTDTSWLRERTEDAEKIAAGFARGEDPYRAKRGIVHRAYRSRLDGELQPYPVFIPPSYRPDGPPLPLVIAFHGLDNPPEIALRTVIGEAPDKDMDRAWAARHLPAFPDQRAILAAPSGYGNAGQRHLGEHDVLEVIEQMKAHYRIDPRRISITGYSMGGTVSFVVPLHYPDVFSASAPLCGYPNLKQWDSVRGVPHAPWEERLIEQRAIVNFAENGMYLPLHVVHGGKDGPERSRVIIDRYKELGYRQSFDVQDDLDHNVWDHGYEDGRMISWLTARRRPEAPARVRLVTGEHRYTSSYWVRILDLREVTGDEPRRFSEIDARWIKDEEKVEVATRGVGAFALDLGAMGAKGKVRAVVDGREVELPEAPAIAYLVAAEGGGWAAGAEGPSLAGKKRPGVSGPLDDVQRHAQLIVYGTQDAAMTEANRLVAEHMSSYDTWAAARYPVKADVDVGEAELTGRSLVLVGGPSSNRITALFAGDLPVRFEQGGIVLRGERYAGAGVGVSLICPHPRDPAEYLVLHAGIDFRGALYSRHLPRLSPDYLVYDARIAVQKGDTLLDRRAVLGGGFFDASWK